MILMVNFSLRKTNLYGRYGAFNHILVYFEIVVLMVMKNVFLGEPQSRL